MRQIIKQQRCGCGATLTDDEVRSYGYICYKCCSKAWKTYEIAHGGQCNEDIKKRHVTPAIKREIIKRDGGRCLKCHTDRNLTVDHITPLSRGGDNDQSNLQTLCANCNSDKATTIADHREVIY